MILDRLFAISVVCAAALSAADAAAITVAAWDCGTYANGSIAPVSVGAPLQGQAATTVIDGRTFLHLAHGQSVAAPLERGPLAEAKPVAIEVEMLPEALPDGYHGGLVEACAYGDRGLRILFQTNRKVSVEMFSGKEPVYLVSRRLLALGKPALIRYEHDGTNARLLIDGAVEAELACPPPAPWSGSLRLGVAKGKDYNYNGAIGKVGIYALAPR